MGTGALVTTYVAVALYGSLFISLRTLLLVVPLLGAVGTVVAWQVLRSLYLECAVVCTPFAPAATAAALFVPFSTGVQHLGLVGDYLVLVVVGLFSVLAANWGRTADIPAAPSPPAAGPTRPAERPDESSSLDLLHMLSLDDLIAEWRNTSEQPQPSSYSPRYTAVRWRDTLLDELRRRDPQGFDSWLLPGMRSAPEHHLASERKDLPGDSPHAFPAR